MTNKELTEQVKRLRSLLAVCEERAEHFRDEAKRLSQENDKLARRNATLVSEVERVGPTGDTPDELEMLADDGSALHWMTKDCECCGRVIGLMLTSAEHAHIFEIHDRKMMSDIAKFAASAAAWIGGQDDHKPIL